MLAKDIKNGTIVSYNDAPCIIESISVQSPSARGAATIYKYRARNFITRQKIDIVLRGGESLDEANFERRPVKFMYADATHLHFLDEQDYNQYALPLEDLEQRSPLPDRKPRRRAGPDLQRPVHRPATAGGGRTQSRRVRSRRPRQLRHQPHQARQTRNRPGRASARVPFARRGGEGRHAERRVSVAGVRQLDGLSNHGRTTRFSSSRLLYRPHNDFSAVGIVFVHVVICDDQAFTSFSSRRTCRSRDVYVLDAIQSHIQCSV